VTEKKGDDGRRDRNRMKERGMRTWMEDAKNGDEREETERETIDTKPRTRREIQAGKMERYRSTSQIHTQSNRERYPRVQNHSTRRG
jgi:hypothetical protein